MLYIYYIIRSSMHKRYQSHSVFYLLLSAKLKKGRVFRCRPFSLIIHKKKPFHKDFYFLLEQMRGIEPPYQPWQGCVLPLNYICILY